MIAQMLVNANAMYEFLAQVENARLNNPKVTQLVNELKSVLSADIYQVQSIYTTLCDRIILHVLCQSDISGRKGPYWQLVREWKRKNLIGGEL